MRNYFIILVAMVTMFAIPHDALARTQKIDDRHYVITRKPKAKKKAKKSDKTIEKTIRIDYGTMRCTAYCDCPECSCGYGRHTQSGTTAEAGRTIAVDPDVISIGSKVEIEGQIYVAEDVGSAVQNDTIDIFFDTHEEVDDFGVQYKTCYVIKD